MCEKEFLDHKSSFLLEIALGFLQSFLNSMGILWVFLLCRRLHHKSSKELFKTAWWSSFLYYTANLYWLAFAPTVEIEMFWWAIPFGLFALPAYISCFTALSTFWIDKQNPKIFPYLFGLSWMSLDWVRGWLFTGFPWAFVGHSWLDTNLIQLASWCGIFPLSFLVFCCYGLLSCQTKRLHTILILTVMISVMYYPIPVSQNSFFDEKVRLVQPNITQINKWEAYKGEERFQLLLNLSRAVPADVRTVILPETALTFFLDSFPERLEQLAEVVPKNGYILTGVPRKAWIDSTKTDYRMRTSLVVINQQGQVVDYYDKTHLIPFGEYLPQGVRYFFPTFSKITYGSRDYTPGIGPRILSLPGLPSFYPIICYESAFPEEITTSQRADFILLITNDAWFGNSVGPKQHLNLGRIRSIEQGLSVVRVANTGISGIIDPKGNLLQSLSLGQRGFIDVSIPKPLSQTFYSKYLHLEKYIMAILCMMLMLELIIRLKNAQRIKNGR